jgi:hypothetical protein
MPTSIGDSAFEGCTALETVNISGFQTIGASAFAGCTALKNVNLDYSNMYASTLTAPGKGSKLLGSIGDYAFDGCTALETITLPDGLQKIGSNKFFNNCSALNYVEVGLDLSSGLSADSFSGCSSLEEIYVAGSDEYDIDPSASNTVGTEGGSNSWNKTYRSVDGALYNCANATKGILIVGEDGENLKDDKGNDKYFITVTKLIAYPAAKSDKDYVAPDTLTEIAENVFENNTHVENVVINTTPTYTANKDGTVKATEKTVKIGKNAFLNSQSLKKLQINNICTIAESAFDGCSNLQTLIHNKNELETNSKIISTIGKYAFRNCALDFSELNCWATIDEGAFTGNKNIKNLVLNSTVGTLGVNAFSDCTGLEYVDATNWNNDISTNPNLGKGVFKGCTALDTVVMNDNLLELTAETFMGCSSLTDVTLGENTADISDSAFSDCTSLEHFKGNKFLVKIATKAFANCTALKDVTLTRSVKIIASDSFSGCDALKTFYAPQGSYVEEFAGGSLRDVTKKSTDKGYITESTEYEFSAIPNEILDKDYLIFDNVKIEADDVANYDEQFITKDGDKYYLKVVKGYRGGFEKLTFNEVGRLAGNKVITPYIDGTFISSCEKESMTKIIKAVDLSGMEVINGASFKGCTNLTTIVFGDNLKTIGDNAFSGCTSLCSTDKWAMTDPRIGESGDVVIADDDSPVFTIPETCTTIGASAFATCKSLQQLDLTAMTAGTVGASAFSGCTALTNAALGDGITSLGASAFASCTSLNTITIGEGCKSIGEKAFSGCKVLENVELGSNISEIGKSAFATCTSLKKIVLPAALETIKELTFSGCTALENVVLNSGLDTIEQNAFKNCTALKVVSLNNGLFVSANAFAGCSNIETVIIPPTVNIADGKSEPFPDADKFTIYCTEGGQAATYVAAKESTGCTLQAVEFDEKYRIKVKTTIPDYITVKDADGNVIESGTIVYAEDVLTVENTNGSTDTISVSGTACEDGTYTVAQNDYDIAFGYMGDLDLNGKVDYADVATLLKHLSGSSELSNGVLKLGDVKVDYIDPSGKTAKNKYGIYKGVDMLDAIELDKIVDNK